MESDASNNTNTGTTAAATAAAAAAAAAVAPTAVAPTTHTTAATTPTTANADSSSAAAFPSTNPPDTAAAAAASADAAAAYSAAVSGGILRTTTVKECIESLWRCSSVAHAGDALRELEQALVMFQKQQQQQQRNDDVNDDHDRHNDHSAAATVAVAVVFDASEAFLAIQGAALRFSASFSDNDDDDHDHDDDHDEITIQLQALRTAATLAEAFVGPAWWFQQQRRRVLLSERGAMIASTLRTMIPHHPGGGGGGDNYYGNYDDYCNNCDDDDDDDAECSVDMSSSVATSSSLFRRRHCCYDDDNDDQHQHVPEVLPAAMIRFAAGITRVSSSSRTCDNSVPDEMTTSTHTASINDNHSRSSNNNSGSKVVVVLQQQIKLVIALCCGDNDDGCNSTAQMHPQLRQWSIPGIQGAVDAMLLSWLETATTSGISSNWHDQNTISLIVSACIRLLSAGLLQHMQLLSTTNHAPETAASLVIDALLTVLLRAKKYNVNTITSESKTTNVVFQAVSAIALASESDMMFEATSVEPLVRAFCQLHVELSEIANPKTRDDAVVAAEDDDDDRDSDENWEGNETSIAPYIGSLTTLLVCQAEIRHTLFELLLHQSKSSSVARVESTVQTLLSIVDVNSIISNTSTTTTTRSTTMKVGEERVEQQQHGTQLSGNSLMIEEANFALCMLCDSFWKKIDPELFLVSGGDCSDFAQLQLRVYWRSAIDRIRKMFVFAVQQAVSSATTAGDSCRTIVNLELLNKLVVNAATSLHLVLEKQNRSDEEILTQLEWDSLVACLVAGVLPWLSLYHRGISAVHFLTVPPLLALVVEFSGILQKQATESVCASFYCDPACRKCLYSMLLRDAVPLLDEDESQALGSAVLRLWYKLSRLAGNGSIEEYENLTTMMNEVFRKSTGDAYIHRPHMRLQGIEILSTWAGTSLDDVASCDSSFESTLLYPSSIQSARKHLDDFIEMLVLPLLRAVLVTNTHLSDGENYETAEIESATTTINEETTTPDENDPVDDELEDIIRFLSKNVDISPKCDLDRFELCCIRLAGALFRGSAVSQGHRGAAAFILRSIAVRNEKTETYSQGGGDSREAEGQHTFSSIVAAIVELGSCLASSFDLRRRDQGSISFLVDTLCAVVNEFTSNLSSKNLFVQNLMLAIYAADTLSRLRLTTDYRLDFLLGHFEYNRIDHVIRRLFLASPSSPMGRTSARSGSRPSVSESDKVLKPVVKSLVRFICVSSRLVCPRSRIFLGALSCLRKACFDLLGALASAKTMRSSDHGLIPLAVFDDSEGGQAEIAARNTALRRYVQQAFLLARDRVGRPLPESSALSTGEAIADAKLLCGLHLRRLHCMSDNERCVACSMLSSLLPGIHCVHHFDPETKILDDVFAAVQELVCSTRQRLSTAPESLASPWTATSIASVLAVIHDLMFLGPKFEIPEELQQCSFHLCYDIVTKARELRECYVCHLALRCASALLDCMSVFAIDRVMSVYEGTDIRVNLMSKVVAEILIRGRSSKDGETVGSRSTSKHDEIVMETEDMERFEVDGESDGCNPYFSAWLYDDGVLLTCRVGASGSRYSGWTEIIIRTATARHRSMVRSPMSASLVLPDFPSSMWIPPAESTAKFARECCDDPILLNASIRMEALSSRFDLMMLANTDEDSPPFSPRSGSPTIQDSRDNAAQTIQMPTGGRGSPQKYNAVQNDTATWLHFVFAKDVNIARTVQNNINRLLESFGYGNFSNGLFLGKTALPRRLAGPSLMRAISVLDRTTEMDTHKMALLYDRSPISEEMDGSTEDRLLASTNFSTAFQQFAEGSGEVTPTHQLKYFSAGLDTRLCCDDGDLAMVWIDEDPRKTPASTSMVVFHIASLMPTCAGQLNRKRHVGNDNVVILYSDDADTARYDVPGSKTIRPVIGGAFGFATILVTSPSRAVRRISLRIRHGLPQTLNDTLQHLVCDNEIHSQDAPMFVRCLAMRADLACRAVVDTVEPPSICLERYRLFLEMRRYVVD